MNAVFTFFLVVAAVASVAAAEVSGVVEDSDPQVVFSGGKAVVWCHFQNEQAEPRTIELRTRLLQASSSIVMPIGGLRGHSSFRVLPSQTVLQKVEQSIPRTRAETRFLVEWIDQNNKVIARTEIIAVPPGLLSELRTILGNESIGLLGVEQEFEKALEQAGVECRKVEPTDLEEFHGKFLIVGHAHSLPYQELKSTLYAKAKTGSVVIWAQDNDTPLEKAALLTTLTRTQGGAIVSAPKKAFANIETNPKAQAALLRLARLARSPTSAEQDLASPE